MLLFCTKTSTGSASSVPKRETNTAYIFECCVSTESGRRGFGHHTNNQSERDKHKRLLHYKIKQEAEFQ